MKTASELSSSSAALASGGQDWGKRHWFRRDLSSGSLTNAQVAIKNTPAAKDKGMIEKLRAQIAVEQPAKDL
jgi:hypothetical protein